MIKKILLALSIIVLFISSFIFLFSNPFSMSSTGGVQLISNGYIQFYNAMPWVMFTSFVVALILILSYLPQKKTERRESTNEK